MLRGDIEDATFKALPNDIEIRYNTVPNDIWQTASEARVTTENLENDEKSTESYDLIIGAGGVRSQVRELAFGSHEQYIEELGYMICAFKLPETPPCLNPGQGVILK